MQNETTTGNHFFQIVKGVALALCFSLLAAVVFANVLRATTVPDKAVYPVNQTIKIVAVSIGTLVFVRGEKGFIKGGAIGLCSRRCPISRSRRSAGIFRCLG